MVQQVKALAAHLTIWQSKFNPRTLSVERGDACKFFSDPTHMHRYNTKIINVQR